MLGMVDRVHRKHAEWGNLVGPSHMLGSPMMQIINKQPPEKKTNDPQHLDVAEIFDTIQGEGPFAGTPATFIRMAGCNLQCPLCDTDYTSNRKMMGVEEIVAQCARNLVVITGGEPFRQDLRILLNNLTFCENRVQIETNGTLYPDNVESLFEEVWVVCSPKTPKIDENWGYNIAAYKYILKAGEVDPTDGLPTRSLDYPSVGSPARPPQGYIGDIFVQPLDQQNEELNEANTQAAVKSCLEHGYRLCLQMHKIVGLP